MFVRQLSGERVHNVYQSFEAHSQSEDSAEFPARVYEDYEYREDENVELKNSANWSHETPALRNGTSNQCPSTIQDYGATK